jgi:hypothetical protein
MHPYEQRLLSVDVVRYTRRVSVKPQLYKQIRLPSSDSDWRPLPTNPPETAKTTAITSSLTCGRIRKSRRYGRRRKQPSIPIFGPPRQGDKSHTCREKSTHWRRADSAVWTPMTSGMASRPRFGSTTHKMKAQYRRNFTRGKRGRGFRSVLTAGSCRHAAGVLMLSHANLLQAYVNDFLTEVEAGARRLRPRSRSIRAGRADRLRRRPRSSRGRVRERPSRSPRSRPRPPFSSWACAAYS